MRAAVWQGNEELAVEELKDPVPDRDEVVADVVLTGICGSDLHAYRGEGGARRPPLILGHEAVVRVSGELFVAFPLTSCTICQLCASGMENLCRDRTVLGLHRPGTFAERVAVRRDCLISVPDGMAPELAVLAEPLATSLSVLRGSVSITGRTVVIGCGAIGLLAVHAAVLRGDAVEVVEPVEARRDYALRLGAVRGAADVNELDAEAADLVIDAVGLEETWTGGLLAVRPGGVVAVVGLAQSTGAVDVGRLVRSGITLRGSYAYSRLDFERALELLANTPPSVTLTTEMALDQIQVAFRVLVDQPSKVIKVVLVPSGSSEIKKPASSGHENREIYSQAKKGSGLRSRSDSSQRPENPTQHGRAGSCA